MTGDDTEYFTNFTEYIKLKVVGQVGRPFLDPD